MAREKLNAKKVAAFKSSDKRIQVFDAGQPGLALRITPSGVKTWSVVYKRNGRMQRLTLGPWPAVSLADARDRAKEALRDSSRGEDPVASKKQRRIAETFEELAADYMERWARKRKKSWQEDERIIEKHLLPLFRHTRAKEVTRAEVRTMLETIAEGAPIQANRVLACLRKIYNWGMSQDIVDHNPCQALVRPGVERRRDRVLSEEELKKVWKAMEAEKVGIAALFKLRMLTAQRGGEIFSMRWKDVDMNARVWTIPAERSKNGLPHRVPLSAGSLRILEAVRRERQKSKNERKRRSPWVFPHRRRPEEPIGEVQKAAQRIRSASGVDFRAHDLRRTAASFMTSMGISRLIVGRILNHAEPGVTAVYDRHSYDPEKRAALEAWSRKLTGVVSDLKRVRTAAR